MPSIADFSRLVFAVIGASALLMLLGLSLAIQALGNGQATLGLLELGWALIAGRMFFVSVDLLGSRS